MSPRIQHVIFDRDGVLNVEHEGGGYITDVDQWRWLPGALAGLARLSAAGVQVSVATNQSCVGRGLATRHQIDAIHAHMRDEAERAGAVIRHVFVCPHAPDDGCDCRKPAPGMFRDAVAASGIARGATLVVGDDRRDLEAARAAGIAAALVRTGKGAVVETEATRAGVPVFDDVPELVAALLADAIDPATQELA